MRLACLFMMGLLASSGCASPSSVEDWLGHLGNVYGQDNVEPGPGFVWIMTRAIEGRIVEANVTDASGDFASSPRHAHAQRLETSKPPGSNGDGEIVQLRPAVDEYQVELRLEQAKELGGLEVRWFFGPRDAQTGPAGLVSVAQTPPTQPPILRLPHAGAFAVDASLLDAGKTVARYAFPLNVSLDYELTFGGFVWARGSSDSPRTPDYENGTDEFRFPVARGLKEVAAATQFRGDYTGTQGTDIDLEVQTPDLCEYSAQQVTSPMVPPTRASDEGLAQVQGPEGNWTARVGALTCVPGAYANPSAVPYSLELSVIYA